MMTINFCMLRSSAFWSTCQAERATEWQGFVRSTAALRSCLRRLCGAACQAELRLMIRRVRLSPTRHRAVSAAPMPGGYNDGLSGYDGLQLAINSYTCGHNGAW